MKKIQPRENMVTKRVSFEIANKWIAVLGIGIFAAAIAYFAFIGSFTRFWADDYCYSALIKQYGWLRGIEMWYLTSGNRFSTIATIGLIDVFGPRVGSFLPLSLLIFWFLGWFIFLDQVDRLFSWKVNRFWLVLIALVQVYFVTLLSPDRLQTIYWRMASLHYSFPMPFMLAQLGLTAGYLRWITLNGGKSRSVFWVLLISGLAAFYNAGQSEPPAFMQAGVYVVIMGACWFFLKGRPRVLAMRLLAVPLAGTLLGILILFVSPYNANRLHYMPRPDNLLLIIPYSIRYVLEFFFYSIRGQITPFVIFMGSCFAVSLLILLEKEIKMPFRSVGIGLALTLFLTIFFTALSFAPSAYANLAYPGGRALMPGCFMLLTGMSALSFFISAAVMRLFRRVPSAWIQFAALVVVLGASLYPIHAARGLSQERDTLSIWADRWDARDFQIRQSISNGIFDIEVKQIEVVRTLEDLGPDPYHWINVCATVYYGARSIIANP
jgi:hypothetical protein